MSRRVIVPDTSIAVAAHFIEEHSRVASRLWAEIEGRKVTTFAPHALIHEFLKTASEKRSRRSGSPLVDPELVDDQVERFFETTASVTFVRETEIQEEAWRLMRDEPISPPDSWMLACAISIPNAELWVSHEHADGFVTVARRLHPQTYTLVTDPKRLP